MMETIKPFNSPIEFALRSIILLEGTYPTGLDLQRMVFYDYLLVHSKDADGPESIHPATPHRSQEFLVKRNVLQQGLLLLMSRKLVIQEYESTGIVYEASELATPFIDSLQSPYILLLKDRADWVINNFRSNSAKELEEFFYKNLDRWGGEFENEALLKYDML